MSLTDDDLKDVAFDLMVDFDVDAVSVHEVLWDTHDGWQELSEDERDALADRVYDLVRTANVSVTWD